MSLSMESIRQLDELTRKTGARRLALVRSAVEAMLAEQYGEKLSFEVPEDLRLDFAALQEALDGASAQQMIARALRDYVAKMLAENPGIEGRFSEIRKQIHEQGGRLIEFRQKRMA